MHNRAFALVLRILATLILLIAVALVALPPQLLGHDPHLAAWTGLLLALGAFAALLALAALIHREAEAPPSVTNSLNRLSQQAMELHGKIGDLQLMYERLSRQSQPETKDYTPTLQKLELSLAEIRDLALLPDSDRKHRVQTHRKEVKTTKVNELFGLVAARDWPTAERLIIGLETEYPNDPEVARGRSYLEHSRRLFETETMETSVREINELMSIMDWENALHAARQLLQGFPTNGDARSLLEHVQREHELHCHTSAQRLFDEFKHDVDQRSWRSAQNRAKRLIERYPEHRHAEQIRGQLKTLTENAEIEERQELEVRIQEMIRGGQFTDAIDLAEDVIRRYPNSPQADSLDALLPRIRQLLHQSAEIEEDVQHLGASE
jgi:outer membrane protein assembly factor BamD (BamD/ComL family)